MRVEIGAFRLVERIGEGGMGVVYRGVHRASGAPVAIKLLPPSYAGQALRREARALAALHHDAIVRVFDAGEIDAEAADRLGRPGAWIAMELVPGSTLADRPPADQAAARAVLARVLRGLAHAHARGVIHRDIKPSNILLDQGGLPRIADFGLAVSDSVANRPRGGTPGYLPPRHEPVGPWTDLFAVGALAACMATGAPDRPVHLHDLEGLDAEDLAWIERMRAPLPLRPRSAAEALRMLPGTPSSGTSDRLRRSSRTSPALSGAGAGLLEVRSLPVQGREPEQDWLLDGLDEVIREGGPRIHLIEGPPGIGKSRLARWISASAHEAHGLDTLMASHGPELNPVDGLAGLVGRALGVLNLPATHALQAAAAELERLGLDEDVQDDLLDVLLPAVSASRRAPTPPRALQWGATRSLVDAWLARGPLVLWLDDVQWGEDTLAWLAWLLEQRPKRALMVVCTTRTTGAPSLSDAGGVPVHRRTLAPLADGAASLTRGLLGVSDALVQQIAELAEGVPLFAVELLRHWLRSGGGSPSLPPSLHALWLTQIEALGPHAIDLERLVALGAPADLSEFRALCDAPEAAMHAFVEQGLVDRREGRLALTHGLLQDSVERSARQAGRWAAHHVRCLAWLRETFGARDRATAMRRARHHRHCEQAEAEVDALLDGLEFELQRGASPQARSARARLADLLEVIHPLSDGPHSRRIRFLDSAADLAFNLGHGEETTRLAEASLAHAQQLGDPEWLAHALWRLASYRRSVQGISAVQLLDQAEALHRQQGSALGLSRVAMTRAELVRNEGNYRGSIALYQALLDDPEQVLSPGRRAIALGAMAETLRRLGERAAARQHLVAARTLLTEHNMVERLAMSENVLGDLARDEGDHASAAEHYERCLRITARLGQEQARAAVFGRLNLAVTRNQLGHGDAALQSLAEVETQLRALRLDMLLVAVHANQVWAHALRDDPTGVEHALARYQQQMALTPMVDPDNERALRAAARRVAGELRAGVVAAADAQREGMEARGA